MLEVVKLLVAFFVGKCYMFRTFCQHSTKIMVEVPITGTGTDTYYNYPSIRLSINHSKTKKYVFLNVKSTFFHVLIFPS